VESRREAEQQLKALIESSPAAILTLDSAGKILMANEAAHRLLGFEPDTMPSQSIVPFLPLLARVPPADGSTPSFRTAMQCRGRRRDGEVFLADLWFSTYQTRSGPRLAAMLVDSSDTLRDREESSLQQLLAGSRLVIGAVSHEIRNICGAISVVCANLARHPGIAEGEDFRALRSLVTALEAMAASQLQQSAGSQELSRVDLDSLLDELRIVIEPELRDSGISFRCYLPVDLHRVWADRQKLLQVLVNLTKNSQRALAEQQRKEITITATADAGRVILRVRDTGPGIAEPERLFRPFQPGAETTGLGLYLSRAFTRVFGADLRYEGGDIGCCFAIDLTAVVEPSDEQPGPERNEQDQDSPTGRSRPVSRGPKPLIESEPDFEMAACCASVGEAVDIFRQKPIDLVLLDFDLGKEDGFQFFASARQAGFEGRVLMVTAGMTDAESVRALGLGVSGIFLKHSSPVLLARAIRKVMAGETWLDQRSVQGWLRRPSVRRRHPQDPLRKGRVRCCKACLRG
jgi:PAS domain S-box-containing protein